MTTADSASGHPPWTGVHAAARDQGLAPALTALCATMPDGLLPCGPLGHGMLTPATILKAERAWCGGRSAPLAPGGPEVLSTLELPGGEVVTVRHEVPVSAEEGAGDGGAGWGLGLVWLRLGLSEALRESVVAYLSGRTSGDTPLIQQQLVKAAVAEALAEHLEIRAVLADARPGDVPAAGLEDLQRRLTAVDRAQVKLLGAGGYLATGPGQVAYVSELLAEAYSTAAENEEPAPSGQGPARSRCW